MPNLWTQGEPWTLHTASSTQSQHAELSWSSARIQIQHAGGGKSSSRPCQPHHPSEPPGPNPGRRGSGRGDPMQPADRPHKTCLTHRTERLSTTSPGNGRAKSPESLGRPLGTMGTDSLLPLIAQYYLRYFHKLVTCQF